MQIRRIMKTKILLIVLSLACTTGFAQSKKKKTTRKKAPATTQPVTPQQQSTALNAAQQPDTTKRQQVVLKPFDRPLDGYYKKTNILSATVTPYPALREADVAYAKRVWREIDIREKMNQYLASPKARLIDVLLSSIMAGELTAYDANNDPVNDPDGDSFAKPLTPQEAYGRLVDSSVVEIQDI